MREIPIFGAPFGQDLFMVGTIDEISCDQQALDFQLLELKTRTSKSLPTRAQQVTHKLQVILYKRMFDDLVMGKITKELLVKHLGLRLDYSFSEDIMKHLGESDLKHCTNLDHLLEYTFEKLQSVPCIKECLVEYCYQGDQSVIAKLNVDYDEPWLERKFKDCAKFWLGTRSAVGVDIEEAWKCQRCPYADDCSWRMSKAEQYSKKNIERHKSLDLKHKNQPLLDGRADVKGSQS